MVCKEKDKENARIKGEKQCKIKDILKIIEENGRY